MLCGGVGSCDTTRYDAVREAMMRGYLSDSLAAIADRRLADLIQRLVLCQVRSAQEMMPR